MGRDRHENAARMGHAEISAIRDRLCLLCDHLVGCRLSRIRGSLIAMLGPLEIAFVFCLVVGAGITISAMFRRRRRSTVTHDIGHDTIGLASDANSRLPPVETGNPSQAPQSRSDG
jgi:hypothetical protein